VCLCARVLGPVSCRYDPTPLYDASTGQVHVFFSYCPSMYMSRPPIPQAFQMWQVTSTDQGGSWGAPVNLSAVPTPTTEDAWCQRTAGGGGNGIQLQEGPHKGRLVVPGYHNHCPQRGSPMPPPLSATSTSQGCTAANGQALVCAEALKFARFFSRCCAFARWFG
jgi:hypothetical protein